MDKENSQTSQNNDGRRQLMAMAGYSGLMFLKLLLRYKYFILIFVVLATVSEGIYAFRMPNWYTATVSAVPPKSSNSMFEGMMGNLGAALKDFGMSRLGGKSEGSYTVLVVLGSHTVKDSIIKKFDLKDEYDIKSNKLSDLRAAFDDNLEINVEPEGNYTVSITSKNAAKAAEMANEYISISNQVALDVYSKELRENREYLEKRLNAVNTGLDIISDSLKLFSKKTNVFSPSDQAKAISSALADIKSEIVKQDIYLQMLKNKYGEGDPYTLNQTKLIDELKYQLQNLETKPGFGGNFPLNEATGVGIEFLRMYAELETFTKVKSFLLPMIEEAKLDEKRQSMALYIIDKAVPPDKKSKPKRSIYILGAFFGSFSLSIFLIILFNAYSSLRQKLKELQD